MRLFPVLIDSRPEYLAGAPGTSLLLMPLGTSTVYQRLQAELAGHAARRTVVVTRFEPDPDYIAAMGTLGVAAQDVFSEATFGARFARYEPSDWFLIRDTRRVGLQALDLGCVLRGSEPAPRVARHIVCLAGTAGGTNERVVRDAEGRVSRIQRYYESVTWSFASGVACSLVPVASVRAVRSSPVTCLSDLRSALAAAGVPSRDVLVDTPLFDLGTEAGLLAVTEALLLTSVPTARSTPSALVDPTARLRGVVVIGKDVVVESNAVIIGPSVLARGSRVGSDALVAQCVLAPGAAVRKGAVARQRVITAGPKADRGPVPTVESLDTTQGAVRELDADPRPSAAVAARRLAEVLLSFGGLVVLCPLLGLIAFLIKADSAGPVLFGDLREGHRGRAFRCWKFRTMSADAEATQWELAEANQVDGPQFKIYDDPRVTRAGRWLRRLNLDEFPQLLNVLMGEMNLVGPRPSPFRENQVCIPWREARLSVPPGITGLWQVCRHDRSSGDFHQWIYYDLLYVHHMSLWLDLKILVATVLSLGGRVPVPLSRLLPAAEFHERRRLPRPADGPDLAHLRRLV